MENPAESEIVVLESLARGLAVEAALLGHQSRPGDLSVAATKSSATDVVTEMDRRLEALLRGRIAEARPNDGVHGEEDSDHPGTSGLTWVIDPIDGTVNYLYGRVGWSVSVAVVTGDPNVEGGWSTVAGAVADPQGGEVFYARAGGGAWVAPIEGGEPTRLKVTEVDELGLALIETGFGYRAEKRAEQAQVVARILPQVRDIRRVGSAALDLCGVAAGRADGYYESGLNSYDIAAGVLIAREAGAVVSGRETDEPTKELLVAAGGQVHVQLRGALLQAGA